ncbi:MAG: 50S ribosomal protein L29 [Thermodesulfobacteriota bacterium]
MSDIQNMSAEDLSKKEEGLREELGKLSFQHTIRPLENTSKLKELRRDIARIMTFKNSKA